MNAIKVDTTIDEAIARAIPALRPLLGTRVELIALQTEAVDAPRCKLTVDEFLAGRLERPEGVAPVTLEAMARAIIEGAVGRAVP
jgi:predicted component of type VI protein secretion system